MGVLPHAEFSSSFPDDAVWDGEEIVSVGGRNVAEAIAKLIESVGYQASALSADAEHYGWGFFAADSERRFWCLVTVLEGEAYLSTEDVTPFWRRWSRREKFGDFLDKLHDALVGDHRFHNVLWFPRLRQPSMIGADQPVDNS